MCWCKNMPRGFANMEDLDSLGAKFTVALQKQERAVRLLQKAGIHAVTAPSRYAGSGAVRVTGNDKVLQDAEQILVYIL